MKVYTTSKIMYKGACSSHICLCNIYPIVISLITHICILPILDLTTLRALLNFSIFTKYI